MGRPSEVGCHYLQVINYGQMLRAYGFALAAFDAVIGRSEMTCHVLVFCDRKCPAFFIEILSLVLIVHCKVLRDGDVLRASACSVRTPCAGDRNPAVYHLCGFCAFLLFFFRQGNKILHVGDIVEHLLYVAHA